MLTLKMKNSSMNMAPKGRMPAIRILQSKRQSVTKPAQRSSLETKKPRQAQQEAAALGSRGEVSASHSPLPGAGRWVERRTLQSRVQAQLP